MRFSGLLFHARRLREDESGNIGLMMGLLAVPLLGAAGLGLDYSRSSTYRLQLDAAAGAAALSAVDTARALLATNPNMPQANVIAAAQERVQKVFLSRVPSSDDLNVLTTSADVKRVGDTISAQVSYTADVKTTFAAIVGVDKLSVAGNINSAGPLVTPENADPNYLVRERFDKYGVPLTFATGVYNDWAIGSAPLEIGDLTKYQAPEALPAPPNGATYMTELDSDANTSISKKIYLPPGVYNIRYYYINRLRHSAYEPIAVCGSKSADIEWANAPADVGSMQTNRVGVYLDPARSDTPPKNLSSGPNNMIDVCVSSSGKWIERSIVVDTKSAGFFWLTFQGEGASDGYGGIVTDIRVCKTACPGTVASSYPWKGGDVLFRDDLELPAGVWPADYFTQYTLGNSGVKTTQSKWSSIPPGWTTTPTNQVEFMKTVVNGQQTYVLPMDSMGGASSNRTISRKFLLAPGTYRVDWGYSVGDNLGVHGTWCNNGSATPETQIAQVNALRPPSAKPADTNRVSVYVDYDFIHGHPEHADTLGATSQWKAWWGGNMPPGWNRIPSQRIDHCIHSSTPVQRSWWFHVLRAGYYWLSFRAEGTQDAWGARLDNIKLVANGGPVPVQDNLWIPIPWPGSPWPGTQVYHANGDFFLTQQ